jgi:hypothetical protein
MSASFIVFDTRAVSLTDIVEESDSGLVPSRRYYLTKLPRIVSLRSDRDKFAIIQLTKYN